MIIEQKVNYPPTSLKRHRHTKYGHSYDPSAKDKLEFVNKVELPENLLEGALKATLHFYEKRPKCHYRTGKYSELLKPTAPHIHTNMPDVDNLSKFILDAMNEVFYEDDRQVVELNSHKEYLNDKKNTTGYTIVHIMPYEKKSSFFNPEQTESFVLTREYMENNKTKHAFNKIFPNHVPDSSSESL